MTRLTAPLADRLADPVDEAAIQAAWQAIRARREERSRTTWIAVGSSAAAAAVLVAIFLASGAPEQAPLRLDDGPLLVGARVWGGGRWDLSDGSSVRAESIGDVEVGEISLQTLHLVLREGMIYLDVRSHGQPAWSVDCGVAMVEITGTKLSLSLISNGVEIKVSEGNVRVKSTALTPPVQYVRAGESLIVKEVIAAEAAPPIERAPPRRTEKVEAPAVVPPTPVQPPIEPAPVIEAPSLDELLRRADLARRAGRTAEAVELLEAVEAKDRGTKGALAAFTLGRVRLDDLSDTAGAAEAFERALGLPLPASLVESALARTVEAHARSGDSARAQARAEEYRRRFSDGVHRPQVEKWSN